MLKRWLCALLALMLVWSCAACGGHAQEEEPDETPVIEEPPEEEEPEVEPEPAVLNPLTGEPLEDPEAADNRPVAVMLNNLHYAMPQHGIADADMIFEYNVEGGVTRMVGFFQEPGKVGTIGSIRSARACFVETVLGMDAVYFHAGGSTEATNMMYRLGMDHYDGDAGKVYWRDAERRKTMAYEHTLMTSGANVAAYVSECGWRTKHKEDYSYPITYVENATPAAGADAAQVTVRFSAYKTGRFDYDAASGKYRISQIISMLGAAPNPYIDGNTGQQVSVSNLLVLRTTVYNSGDSSGHMVIQLQGGGAGVYFCGGKAEEITWRKATMNDPFTYYHADGTPLALQTGHTYVCVIANDASLTYGTAQ